jgi:hypothetical protein
MDNTAGIEKPGLVVFSSGKVAESGVTDAIRDQLTRRGFTVTPWNEGFFPANELALNAFLKKLLCYDAALLVLGDDDIRHDPAQTGKEQHVPRDNVIFELGACMSRLGPKKTFIVRPDTPKVVLPSYFHGVGGNLTYENKRVDGNWQAAVGSACAAIAKEFANFDRSAFFSDLPAGGLAYGYFHNFLLPTYNAFNSGHPELRAQPAGASPSVSMRGPKPRRSRSLEEGLHWDKDLGFRISVLIPETPLNRDQVQSLFTDPEPDLVPILGGTRRSAQRSLQFVRLQVSLADGRNIAIYAERRVSRSDSFRIFDVPTTLLTSQEVISKVDAFWGAGDVTFRESLARREALNFSRTLALLINNKRGIEIIDLAQFIAKAFKS